MSDERATGMTGAVLRAASLSVLPARRALALLARSSGVDWEAEGLLEGVTGDSRDQRRELLERLAREGVALDELRTAVEEDRLPALPVQRVLAGDDCYTLPELAELAGIEPDTLRADLANLGMGVPPDEAKAFDDYDLAAAKAIASFRAAGLDEHGLQGVGRVLGQSMRTVADSVRELLSESVRHAEGDHEFGLRYAELAGALATELQTVVGHTLRVHMREGIRYEVVGGIERTTGHLPDTDRMTVAFADLAGFTILGETAAPTRVGEVGDRFASLAVNAAKPPVRLMKLLGDGAILAGPDPESVLEATLKLARELKEDPLDMPQLHAGVATGQVVARRGELYGSTPNLAARLAALADPGCILADGATREQAPDLPWKSVGRKRPKGFERAIELYALT